MVSPYINRFLQPDTIIPNVANPQNWNRFSYVTNRPIILNDPTGHIACYGDRYDDGPQCTIKTDFWHGAIKEELNWKAAKDFTLKELKTIYQVGVDIADHVGGADVLRQMLGSVDFDKKVMSEGGLGEAHHVTLNENFSKWSLSDQRWIIAHEVGHAWDGANGWALSKGLQDYVHSIYPTRISKDEYDYGSPGNGPGATGWPDSSWGVHSPTGWNAREDFAQSFAAYIYVGTATQKLWDNYHQTYSSGYNSYYDTPRGQYIADQIRGYWPFY